MTATDAHIIEKCSCGASVDVTASAASVIVAHWRTDHLHTSTAKSEGAPQVTSKGAYRLGFQPNPQEIR